MRTFHRCVLVIAFPLVFPPTLSGQPFSRTEIEGWQERAKKVTIIRDRWGVPHIYGASDADAVFGLLYAQCEDDFVRVERNYITALGRLSEVEGERYVYHDLRVRLFADTARAIRIFEKSPAWLRKLMIAFADGINHYLVTHPEVKPSLLYRFKPWFPLLFSEGSIGGDLGRISIAQLQQFYADFKSPPSLEMPSDIHESRGSNGFAIAPSRSVTGNALLLINPHTSFYFRSEVHIVSEEGLNAYGAVTWGQFFVYQGFNASCGWMHTSSYADAVDEYEETVARRNGAVFYRHDGKWKPVAIEAESISFRTSAGLQRRQFSIYRTHHGPVIAAKNEKWIAIAMMDDPLTALKQSFLRTKATGYASYRKVMDLKANSSNNTIFADNKGNIAYWHGNFIPKRDPALNWNLPADGTNPATDWNGLHSVDDIVHLVNPENGWIQNCNSTPFTSAGDFSPKKNRYPIYMAPDGQNYRAINAGRLLSMEPSFTMEKLIVAAYDPTLAAFDVLIPSLRRAFDALPDDDQLKVRLRDPLDTILAWDRRSTAASVAGTLCMLWGRLLQEHSARSIAPALLAQKRSDQVFMINWMSDSISSQTKLNAMAEVIDQLEKDFGTWRTPWGEINRYQRLSGNVDPTFDDRRPSLPVGLASSFWGSLAAYASNPFPGTTKFYGHTGNSFVAVVEFGERVRAKSVVTGGASSNPGSPHFDDQALMFTRGEFKDVLFYKEDVLKHTERSYHPGQ